MKNRSTKEENKNSFIIILSALVLASILLLLLVATGATQKADEEMLVRILSLRTPLWNEVFQVITQMGSYWFVAIMMAAGAILLFRMIDWRTSAVYVTLVGAGSGLSELLKLLIARPRPALLLNLSGEGYSYPSAHTMAAICCYLGLAWFISRKYRSRPLRWAMLTVAGAVVSLVGFSRMYLGWHYPTDVLGSVIMGLSLLFLSDFMFRRLKKSVRGTGFEPANH